MIWEPVDLEKNAPSFGKHSSFFLQQIPEKHLLFIHDGGLTTLLVLQFEGNRLRVHCVKKIPSNYSIFRITGNNNCILMLDVKEELFYLQGAVGNNIDIFNQSNGNKFLVIDGVLSWQRLHQLTNCLAMSGITNSVSFLYHNVSVYSAHYGTAQIKTGLYEISKERLKEFDVGVKYFVSKIEGNMAELIGERVLNCLVPAKEVLLITEQSKMYFVIPTPDGTILSQPYSIDLQTDFVINVLCFKKKCCILIICKSGKFVCLRFGNSCKSFQFEHAWLPKDVTAITGYEDDTIYLLWSDLNNLYKSTFDDNNVVRNLKVPQNIRGVRHFVKIEDNIIALTINGCLYETKITSTPEKESNSSSQSLLNKMFQTAKEMENMIDEVAAKENLTRALHISRIPNISQSIHVTEKDGFLVLENNTEYTFQKGLWRILIEMEETQRKHIEMKELETDIVPGSSVSLKCTEKTINMITLCCNIMDNMNIIELEVKNEGNNLKNEDQLFRIRQFIKEKCTFIA